MTKNKKIIIGVVGVVISAVLVIALLGMYKPSYVSGLADLVGYDMGGNKAKVEIKKEASNGQQKRRFDLYSCASSDKSVNYLLKKFATDTETETTKIVITSPTDKDYMKDYTLNYVKSGSGEKFTGKGIEF
jgi:uncharacterized protein YxeA